jgi:predicted RNA-binding Zn ribbon-like protein
VGRVPALEEAGTPGAVDLVRLRELRVTVRVLLDAVVAGRPLPPREVDTLNAFAADVPVVPRLFADDDRPVVRWSPQVSCPGLESALARDAMELVTSEDAGRLRECEASDCDRLFVQDHGRRRWCSTACGDRMRSARHYAKVRHLDR